MPSTPKTIIIGKRSSPPNPFEISTAFHFLKTESEHFNAVRVGSKKAEVRKNDRDFRVGDVVVLVEIDGRKRQTGHYLIAEITHLLTDHRYIRTGFVMLSLRVLHPSDGTSTTVYSPTF